jgi:hypothetical protein
MEGICIHEANPIINHLQRKGSLKKWLLVVDFGLTAYISMIIIPISPISYISIISIYIIILHSYWSYMLPNLPNSGNGEPHLFRLYPYEDLPFPVAKNPLVLTHPRIPSEILRFYPLRYHYWLVVWNIF